MIISNFIPVSREVHFVLSLPIFWFFEATLLESKKHLRNLGNMNFELK